MGARRIVVFGAGTILVAAGLLLGCNSSNNSPSAPSGSIDLNARLVRSAGGAPIPGAQVMLNGQPTGVVTNEAGILKVNVPAGIQTIGFNAGTAASRTMRVGVGADVSSMDVTFELADDGTLSSHEDVDDDNDIDADDDIDDDKDIDIDDADGDIDDDGDIDVDEDIDDDGDNDLSDLGDDHGTDDAGGDDNGDDDGIDDPGEDGSDDPGEDENGS